MRLYAPPRYWDLSEKTRQLLSNGCGTDGWKGKLVPESMYGLNISAACDIHDYMYLIGETQVDKEEADRVFLNNLLRIIENRGGWLAWFRRRRALKYYEAVEQFGGPAFWNEKNPPTTIQSTGVTT